MDSDVEVEVTRKVQVANEEEGGDEVRGSTSVSSTLSTAAESETGGMGDEDWSEVFMCICIYIVSYVS